jgi:hypothetical protein
MNLIGLERMRVFRCGADKRPQTRNGFKDAVLWRRIPKEWPRVGVPTGAVNGIDIVDVDTKKGAKGADWFWRHFEGLPKTRMQVTESGGYHVFFKHAEGLRCSSSRIAEGVDVRADGGYVIDWSREGLPVANAGLLVDWPEDLLAAALGSSNSVPQREHKVSLPIDGARCSPIDGQRPGGDAYVIGRRLAMLPLRHGRKGVERLFEALGFAPTRQGYARIENLRRQVERPPSGKRNEILFFVACRFAEMVAEGEVKADRIIDLLRHECWTNGLLDEPGGDREMMATIASAFGTVERQLAGAWRQHNGGPP